MDCKAQAAVVMNTFKGKTTVAEVVRQYDLTVSEVASWIDEAQRSVENGFKARPKDIQDQYGAELRKTWDVNVSEGWQYGGAALFLDFFMQRFQGSRGIPVGSGNLKIP